MNGRELFGRVTTVARGMVFPESGDNLLRHPRQLYEVFFLKDCYFL
jgi:phosphatidylglycerol:prolipoprotein diacylglycerol transferase